MNFEEKETIRIFYSYSHKDEEYRRRLETHLSLLRRQGIIAEWHDRKIVAGDEWKGAIDSNIRQSQLILLLISPDFVASDYCYDVEMTLALNLHEQGLAKVIPIILRPVDNWQSAPFSKLQALPQDGKPVTKWSSRDDAFMNCTQGIRKAIEEFL